MNKVEKAPCAGMCHKCGNPIYAGDRIVRSNVLNEWIWRIGNSSCCSCRMCEGEMNMPKTWQQKVKYVAWWYSRWRNANGISGNADSDWQWASSALTSFPLVGDDRLHYKRNQRITDPNGHCQIVTSGGAVGPETPVWSQAGGVTIDGNVAWLDMGAAAPW